MADTDGDGVEDTAADKLAADVIDAEAVRDVDDDMEALEVSDAAGV